MVHARNTSAASSSPIPSSNNPPTGPTATATGTAADDPTASSSSSSSSPVIVTRSSAPRYHHHAHQGGAAPSTAASSSSHRDDRPPTINLALPAFFSSSASSSSPSAPSMGPSSGLGSSQNGRLLTANGRAGPTGPGMTGGNGLSWWWNQQHHHPHSWYWHHVWRPRLIIATTAALIFFLGYITGSGSPIPSHQFASTATVESRRWKRNQIPFLLRPDQLFPAIDPPEFAVEAGLGGRKVPPYVHYVFGLSPDFGGKPFGFIQYAALQSAVQILHPEKVLFHYLHEPQGWWWDRAKEVPGFIPVQTHDVTEVFGRPIEHFAHKADVIRLEALRDWGGIYLDTDVFLVRDFDPLLSSDVVMAEEAQPALNPRDPPSGLCNAVIVARPFAPFIMRWIESYRTFDKGLWATHSVAKPWDLARQHPNEITVLNHKAFFYPLWHEDHVDMVHNSMNWDFDRSGQYCYHAWESLTWNPHLQALDPDRIHVYGEGETSFTRFVRRYIHEPIRKQWRDAHARGEV